MGLRAGLDGCGKSRPTGIRSPDRPARSESEDGQAGWDSGPVWIGAENLAPTGIRSPDRPPRRQSLYRLATRPTTYTGCPRRNVSDFGRVFLMLKYTDITQNTYVQS